MGFEKSNLRRMCYSNMLANRTLFVLTVPSVENN
jgi:hypothetical protein